MRKENDAITIKDDVRVPGTDIILEKGDSIKIIKEASGDIKDLVNTIYTHLSKGTYLIKGPSRDGIIMVEAPLGGGEKKTFKVTVEEK